MVNAQYYTFLKVIIVLGFLAAMTALILNFTYQPPITGAGLDTEPICGYPPGTIVAYGGDTIPDGWLLCNGASVAITDCPDLYKAIDMVHGTADVGFFKLPNLLDRFIMGLDDTMVYATLERTGGLKEVKLTEQQLPPHQHTLVFGGNDDLAQNSIDQVIGGMDTVQNSSSVNPAFKTSSVGGGLAHENRPPFYPLVFIIKK